MNKQYTFNSYNRITNLILLFLFFGCNSIKETPSSSGSKFAFIDYSNMIPIRTAKKMDYDFEMSLTGSAIKNNRPFNIHFDTGSFSTTIPYSAIDKTKITVLQKGAKDNWGQVSDLVSGQICVKSVDGKTNYCLDDFKFYAIESGRIIMGAFPKNLNNFSSFPFELANKYAAGNEGFGIVSKGGGGDISTDWKTTTCYLQLGLNKNMESKLNWRSDIPNLGGGNEFSPDAIPGYSIEIKIPNSNAKIKTEHLIATIDTGAPDMTLRLGKTDPQYSAPFSSHFIKQGPWESWNNEAYNQSATSLIDALVTVNWEDDKGEILSYSYPVSRNPYPLGPNTLIAGEWNSNIPWDSKRPDTPKHRINLGNSIYFFCPVYYYDIKNKRIGIGFNHKSNTTDFIEIKPDQSTLLKGEQISGSKKLISSNEKFQCRITEKGRLVVEKIKITDGKNVSIIQEIWSPKNTQRRDDPKSYLILQGGDGNLCFYTSDNKFRWCGAGSIHSTKIQLTNEGSLVAYNKNGAINWSSSK